MINLIDKFKHIVASKKGLEINGEEVGKISLTPKSVTLNYEGKKFYGKIPKEIRESILPENNQDSFSRSIYETFKEGDSLFFAVKCWKGTHGNSVNSHYFVGKLEGGKLNFSDFMSYSHSNNFPQILEITKDYVFYDISNTHLFENEMSCFTKSFEEGVSSKEWVGRFKYLLGKKSDPLDLEKLGNGLRIHELSFNK